MDHGYIAAYEQLEREHWWWLARRGILLRLIDTLTRSWSPDRRPAVLDLGCGAGLNLAALRQRADCQGIEPDPFLAERARANSGVAIHAGSLPAALPALDRRFDFVTLLDVLEHVDDDVTALKTAAALLSPGGRVIVNVPALPALWSEHDVMNHHKRRYLRASLRDVIRQADLNIALLRYWGATLVPLAWIERRARRWRGANRAGETYSVKVPGPVVNSSLCLLVRSEYALSSWLRPPLGLSLLAVAELPRRPEPGRAGELHAGHTTRVR